NGVLYASLSDDTFVSYDFIISVTMPAVEAVKASGSSSISMSGFDVEDLSVSLSGSSSATVDLESAKTVSLSISEASDIKLISDNEAESVSLTCTGASEAVLKNFSTESAEVYISDASEAWIKSSGSISGQVSGVSTLHYSASDISGLTVTETSYIKSF
ncbi:MAG: DUF2807 domain-containing protein, partial [Spirochaetales bacterium]|nr:DUF2807 domain-containing protein [Spirochaetales bacterium]